MFVKLREHVPYLINVWKAKKHNSYDCQISIGGGRSAVNFKVSALNKYEFAWIYLHFESSQETLYTSFQEKVAELRTVHPAFKVKNRR